MALINRVSQLFRADFNAVLDQIEEPEQLLKQAVRDMEDELAASERRISICSRNQEALLARRAEILKSLGELEEQLDLCFESGKEDLARGIVRRKLEAGRLIKRLDTKLEANERFLDRERKQLEENRSTLEGLRQKAELFVSCASGDDTAWSDHDFARMSQELRVGDDEVEIAFLREQAARSAS
jgi:phage shock protein A